MGWSRRRWTQACGCSAAGWPRTSILSWWPVTGRSPLALTRRPRSSTEGSRSSTCPLGRQRWSGPRRSRPPAAVLKRSASSCPTRRWATERSPTWLIRAPGWNRTHRLGQTVWSARRLARKLSRVAVGSGPAVEPLLREAPVMGEGSWVGLDVDARSVAAGVIDAGSGEVRSLRVRVGSDATVAWLQTLPAPVRVVYEAGPTGYGLARACAAAGISCVVAAPSKIRPAADRVKTDRRDAERLARLRRLGEIPPVRVPCPVEEAARDLVRAREDARGDLMRARHRLSKLLLRHGAVYDATAWTRDHDAWLRRQRFLSGPRAIVFDECYGRMLDAKTRRDA